MAFGTGTIWDVRSAGDDTNNGGGFDPSNANFATDLAATSATGSSPVVTSASYTFVAGDVGAWLYVKSGTNWTTGWYQIASVSAGAATLSAAIGVALQGGAGLFPANVSTAAGCATTASPSSGTWGVDYSKQDSGQFSFTDMVIDATTNTKFTSAAFPVGKNFVGNVVSVTAGTGFTVQRAQVVSTSSTVATCDRSLGTTSSTGGTGKLGGALATPGLAQGMQNSIGGQYGGGMFVKAGTYNCSSSASVSGGKLTQTQVGIDGVYYRIVGYSTTYLDFAARPVLLATADSMKVIEVGPSGSGGNILVDNIEVQCGVHTSVKGFVNTAGGGTNFFRRCYANGLNTGFDLENGTGHRLDFCTAKSCTAEGFWLRASGTVEVLGCVSTDNGTAGFEGFGAAVRYRYCVAARNSGGFANFRGGTSAVNCVAYGNGTTGIRGFDDITHAENCVAWGNSASNGFENLSGKGYLLENCAGGSNGNNYDTTSYPPTWVIGFIALSADPFTSASTNDFSLNSAAGGGALLKAAGWGFLPPNALSNPTSHLDIGAYQSSGSGGGGSTIFCMEG